MKQLRYILVTAFITIGIFSSVVVYTSCNKNKCGSTTCQNGGSCSGNVCLCPYGYSGVSCQTGWSDIFIGTYKCTRNSCSPAVGSTDTLWISAITRDVDGATVDISNFDGSGKTIIATVDSFQRMAIGTTGTYGISADGNYANGVINLKFTTSVAGGVGGYTCKMVLTKE